MNSFFLYTFKYIENNTDVTATVIYCSSDEIDEFDLQSEISSFFQDHSQPDKIYVLGSQNILERLKEVIITNQNKTFKGIPKKQEIFLSENLYLISFNKNGEIRCENKSSIPEFFLSTFRNQGLQNIFICRGGLITSESSHHYVFPSGKHCDRFLRTGNILLYSPEISFIAFCLLKHFDENKYSRIYCDTSSINSIAYALFDLKNSFLPQRLKITIESFSSYDGLYQKEESYSKESLLLISASTSSNILKYVLDKHKILDRHNIVVLYFHGKAEDYSNVKDQVLCNLTKSKANESGIDYYPTYQEKDCEFCKKGSYAVPVSGDVFLLEKPKVNKIVLSVKDRDKHLSDFVGQFLSINKTQSIFKSNFKERSENKYEVYIDFCQILKSMGSNVKMEKFYKKVNDFISLFIPAETKYILFLDDNGSKDFSDYLLEQISSHYKSDHIPRVVSQNDIGDISNEVTGTVVVVGSCISNGKNLLYISRALRKFDKLKILYFIGIVRTYNKSYLNNLTSNLKRGKYGAETNGFVNIETMFCSNNSKATPWLVEIEFIKDFVLYLKNHYPANTASIVFFETRKKKLEDSSGEMSRGLSSELFLPRITTETPEELSLRKNFAFFDFEGYIDDATQADVYFTICNIINSLRNSEDIARQLKQAVYVRTLIDPHNFSRFNDGVIQASILRAASSNELSYSIDHDLSLEMFNTLETITQYHTEEQGEALLEFLYAIAIKKLSLVPSHLSELLNRIEKFCKNEIFISLKEYINAKLIEEPLKLRTEPFKIES